MLTVEDVMTTSVISVREDTPLKDVAGLLVEQGISGVPVIDAAGSVVGVVSEADFVLKEIGSEGLAHRRLGRLRGESNESRRQRSKRAATTAAEAMTAPAITIGRHEPVSQAARVMTERGINRLLVIDDGALVGLVSRADLVRAYVRSDQELVETIREEVLHRLMWLDPAGFAVDVRAGVATVTGHVEQRSTAEMVGTAVAMVPGIIDVHASVSWSMDDTKVAAARIDPFFPFSPR
jgi:CBS domain-containing protein